MNEVNMFFRSLFIFMFFVLSGCAVLEHLDQLSTLGDYARDKSNQDRVVKSINAHYDRLLAAIANKSISHYDHKGSFINAFGQPILKENRPDGSAVWLYRYAVLKMAKDKVYVYFDRKAKLIKWEKLPCPSLF